MVTAHRPTVSWRTDILPRATKRALAYLSGEQWLKKSTWYLAGGTALALYIGHRQSVDLDFFTPQKDFSPGKLLGHFKKQVWVADIVREGTIYGKLCGAKTSFIAYPYFVPRQPYHWYGAVRMLDPRDITVMKVLAISQRGRKRDFIDLYWCTQHVEPLIDIVKRLPEQYPGVARNFHHIIKSLTYFADAEADPMPKIFFSASWRGIKRFFEAEASKAARELLGIR